MADSVLIADDDPEFFQTLQQSLAGAGYTAIWAPNGIEALARLREEQDAIRAAVVDLDLPGMSGFDLIREVATKHRRVKILAVSSIYREFYLGIALNVGADMARRKTEEGGDPLPGEEWMKILSELLRDSGETPSA